MCQALRKRTYGHLRHAVLSADSEQIELQRHAGRYVCFFNGAHKQTPSIARIPANTEPFFQSPRELVSAENSNTTRIRTGQHNIQKNASANWNTHTDIEERKFAGKRMLYHKRDTSPVDQQVDLAKTSRDFPDVSRKTKLWTWKIRYLAHQSINKP